MIERGELSAWLRLLQTAGVGRDTARRLLASFGSPQAVFAAPAAALKALLTPALADALSQTPKGLDDLVQTTWDWLNLADGLQRQVLTLGDTAYPPRLLNTADPPLLLYLTGRAELLQATSVALVGSRNPTPQGLDNARRFATHLSQAGLCVVSGLALGIDGASHEGGLAGPGRSVAVVGTGLDRIYPRQHQALARRLAEEGALVSEYPLGSPPLAAHFPQRNRIIAGLSLGTLVVEAAVKSGSLITARMALESGREVFAIPGSIHSPQSRGCHALIKQGAKLVESAQDILEELQLPVGPAAQAPPAEPGGLPGNTAQQSLLGALGHDPVSLDALVARTGESAASLSAQLLDLELDGLVARLPGQLFQRVGQA